MALSVDSLVPIIMNHKSERTECHPCSLFHATIDSHATMVEKLEHSKAQSRILFVSKSIVPEGTSSLRAAVRAVRTRDDRSTECIVSLSDTVSRPSGSIDVRQCHRRFVSDETGRYSLTADVPTSEGSTAPSTRHTYYPSGQTHSGGEECTSGPSLPTRQGGSHGIDVSPDSSGFTVHHVGQTQYGPVCDSPQQQASGVCVTHGRTPSGRGRCHVDIMEGNVRLCIPPICDAGARAREDPRRSPLRVDPHCSQMAQSVLVRQTIGNAGRLSFGPASQERSADPATQPSETSVTPSCAPTRLEAVQRSLEEKAELPS